jgi:transcriptional regulator with XRE-family HTH domain
MLDINEIIKRLSDRNLKKVADECRISYDTVWRIANGKSKQPSYAIVKKLSDYLLEMV